MTLPRPVPVAQARAWRGTTRIARVGDHTVAWIDSTTQVVSPITEPDLDASPQWLAARDLLIGYVSATGTIPTVDTIVNGYALGKWMQRQRTAFTKIGTGSPEALSAAKVRALEAIPGWVWTARRGRPLKHEEWFAHLPEYLRLRADGVPAGAWEIEWSPTARFYDDWEIRQHDAYRDGTMPGYRRTLLAALPWWTWRTRARPYGDEPVLSVTDLDPKVLAAGEMFTDVAPQRLTGLLTTAVDQATAAATRWETNRSRFLQ